MLVPAAPLSLVQHTTCPTSAGKAVPVSCGARSTTDFATTASATLIAGAVDAAGAAAGAFGVVESCARRALVNSWRAAATHAMRFILILRAKGVRAERQNGGVELPEPHRAPQ